MRSYFLIICSCISINLSAQNIVFNPDFERFAPSAPDSLCHHMSAKQFNSWLPGWSTFDVVTPDIIRLSSEEGYCEFADTHAGDGAIGFYNFHPWMDAAFENDYHEFVQGTLTKALSAGTTYYVRFWIQLNNRLGGQYMQETWPYALRLAPRACNNIGIYFSTEQSAETENFPKSVKDFSIRPQVNFTEIIKGEGDWSLMEAQFTASQPYRYFIIGNFYTDFRTEIFPSKDRQRFDEENSQPTRVQQKIRRFSYYVLDDIYVGLDAHVPNMEEVLAASGVFIFQNVQFNSGKSDLLPASFEELDALTDFLNKHPEKKVEIGGHTDNVGNDAANQQLSEARAKAVHDYLIGKGISAERLTYVGFGEQHPIVDNDTAAGRAKNRRVECLLAE